MAKKLPLTRTRFHALLALFDGPLTMTEKGGYDTGVYFSFAPARAPVTWDAERIVGARLVDRYGFCSERMYATDSELARHGGLSDFWSRVRTREDRLKRWADEYCLRSQRKEFDISKPTVRSIVRALSVMELTRCAQDALTWQDRGELPEGELRTLAARLEAQAGISAMSSLEQAEAAVLREVTLRFIALQPGG